MAMIPLASADIALPRESSSRHRLQQAPQDGESSYLLAEAMVQDVLQEETAPLLLAPAAEQGEQPEESGEEQLQAFNPIPPSFILREEHSHALASEGGESHLPLRGTAAAPVMETKEIALQQSSFSFQGLQPRSMMAEQEGRGLNSNELSPKQVGASGQEISMAALVSRQTGSAKVLGGEYGEVQQGKQFNNLQAILQARPQTGEREAAVLEQKFMVSPATQLALNKPAEYQWAPVRLPDNQAQWGQQLIHLLHDKVELQVNQQIKQAHIRLDPPELGRLELTVRIEGDRLNVQLNAAHPAVRDALIQSMEKLRMSLAPHHSGGVDVNVGHGGEQNSHQHRQGEQILVGRQQWLDEVEQSGSGRPDWLNTLV